MDKKPMLEGHELVANVVVTPHKTYAVEFDQRAIGADVDSLASVAAVMLGACMQQMAMQGVSMEPYSDNWTAFMADVVVKANGMVKRESARVQLVLQDGTRTAPMTWAEARKGKR